MNHNSVSRAVEKGLGGLLLAPCLVLVLSACVERDSALDSRRFELTTENPVEAFAQLPEAPQNPISIPGDGVVTLSLISPVTRLATPIVASRHIVATRGGSLFATSGSETFVNFRVPRRALDEDTTIEMTVVGTGVGVQAHFQPAGLRFIRPASLSFALLGDDIDPNSLGGYLRLSDGTTVEQPHSVYRFGRLIVVQIWVSHFSIYEPDDGE